MYGAVRQRAPSSTKITGIVVTVLAMVGAGYALMNGIGGRLVEALSGPMTVATLPAEKPAPLDAVKDLNIPSEGLPTAPPLPIPDDGFVFTQDEGIKVIEGDGVVTGGGGGLIVLPPPIKVTYPRLMPQDEPPYPPSEIRANNQGTSGLELCVSAGGRVTAASLVASSGHAKLDDAALKWVRGARFSAGTVDGMPQAMCGHRIAYEWRIEGSR